MRDRGARDLTRAESSNLAAAKNLLFTSSEHDDRDLHSGALCKQDELELICFSSLSDHAPQTRERVRIIMNLGAPAETTVVVRVRAGHDAWFAASRAFQVSAGASRQELCEYLSP